MVWNVAVWELPLGALFGETFGYFRMMSNVLCRMREAAGKGVFPSLNVSVWNYFVRRASYRYEAAYEASYAG